MADFEPSGLIVEETNSPPCMRCVYLPEHPPSIEAMAYWGREGVFLLESDSVSEADGGHHRVWRTPPQWPVRCCREEDLKILEMVDPATAFARLTRFEPRSLSR